MKNMKKTILTVAVIAVAATVIGAVAFSAGLGDILPKEGVIAAFLGRTPLHFGMKCCLFAVLGTIFLIPSIRAEFLGSYTLGSDYTSSHKKGHSGKI
ncbi:hypothetical protein [Anaerotruncus colihominis]|uniref:Uncharacterized protein n=1 Tax=Anaerotruncus colihominis TaxID=169435 RepID=A0A845SSG8_9FIRM|nr:hypothetical protein [Anaerotruncus colihominis]NDO37788.1 hypothetical protein [Anaerotruncus colihominis]